MTSVILRKSGGSLHQQLTDTTDGCIAEDDHSIVLLDTPAEQNQTVPYKASPLSGIMALRNLASSFRTSMCCCYGTVGDTMVVNGIESALQDGVHPAMLKIVDPAATDSQDKARHAASAATSPTTTESSSSPVDVDAFIPLFAPQPPSNQDMADKPRKPEASKRSVSMDPPRRADPPASRLVSPPRSKLRPPTAASPRDLKQATPPDPIVSPPRAFKPSPPHEPKQTPPHEPKQTPPRENKATPPRESKQTPKRASEPISPLDDMDRDLGALLSCYLPNYARSNSLNDLTASGKHVRTGSFAGSVASMSSGEVATLPPSPLQPSQQNVEGPRCDNIYDTKLHKSRGHCQVCIFHLSPQERAAFDRNGRHLRVKATHGGCKGCKVFTSEQEGDDPVRLCRQCFFTTHKLHVRKEQAFGGGLVLGGTRK